MSVGVAGTGGAGIIVNVGVGEGTGVEGMPAEVMVGEGAVAMV